MGGGEREGEREAGRERENKKEERKVRSRKKKKPVTCTRARSWQLMQCDQMDEHDGETRGNAPLRAQMWRGKRDKFSL